MHTKLGYVLCERPFAFASFVHAHFETTWLFYTISRRRDYSLDEISVSLFVFISCLVRFIPMVPGYMYNPYGNYRRSSLQYQRERPDCRPGNNVSGQLHVHIQSSANIEGSILVHGLHRD